MSEMSPKELDKLFQQGSEQYDFEYNAQAWVQMEALLDKKRRRRFIWWWFGGITILLLAGGLGFVKKDDIRAIISDNSKQKIESIGSFHTEIDIEDKEQYQQGEKHLELRERKLSLDAKIIEDSIEDYIHEQSTLLKSTFPNEKALEHKKQFNDRKEAPPIATLYNPKTEQEDVQVSKGRGEQTSSIQDDLPVSDVEILDRSEKGDVATIAELPTLILLPLEYDNEMKRISSSISADEQQIEKKEKPSTKKGTNALILGLMGGTELASAGTDGFSKINWKIGGQVEYRYAHKYSFGVGANFIRKTYEAGKDEYTPPKGFWVKGIAPQSSEGNCNILEIPVLLGYFPKGYFSKGFYSNVGFSSYLMLTERYNYFYESSDPSLIRAWGTENENSHWFGIGHIAIGYNYVAKHKYSFQIEPYLQFPLTGVGHGQVKLWSAGVSFKANWQMN